MRQSNEMKALGSVLWRNSCDVHGIARNSREV